MAASPPARASVPKQKRKATGRADGGYKIAGTVLPWDPDIDLDRPTPTPLFPLYKPTTPQPLITSEKARVASFLSFRARLHEGPFYTILDPNSRIEKSARTPAAASFDPFEGMPTYSQRYVKKRRRLPKLSARPHVMKYFPKELWSTLDPHKYKSVNGTTSLFDGAERRIRNPAISTGKPKDTVGKGALLGEGTEEATTRRERDPNDEDMQENLDDDFDEDDEDGGDYNAEQYFDDGGDDAAGDLDGGDADEGGYY
ncbi:MAG: hypothetical protein L6R37_004675 [Teloschistes peruensis]|nr:MAG: hypothetical protein L6R37_004675 [Teloschistes peruensis]